MKVIYVDEEVHKLVKTEAAEQAGTMNDALRKKYELPPIEEKPKA